MKIKSRIDILLIFFIMVSISFIVTVLQTVPFVFPGFIDGPVNVPVDILSNSIIIFLIIYGGVESSVSIIGTIKSKEGESKPLPEHKARRLFNMVIVSIIYTTFAIAIYFKFSNELASKGIDPKDYYNIDSIMRLCGTCFIIYVTATRGSKSVISIERIKKEKSKEEESEKTSKMRGKYV